MQDGLDSGAFPPAPGRDELGMAYAAWALVHGIAMLRLTKLRERGPEQAAVDRAALQALMDGYRREAPLS